MARRAKARTASHLLPVAWQLPVAYAPQQLLIAMLPTTTVASPEQLRKTLLPQNGGGNPARHGPPTSAMIEQRLASGPRPTDSRPQRAPNRRRIRSLDVLRGAFLLCALATQAGGTGWSQTRFAQWDEFRLADVASASFAFVAGATMAESLEGQHAAGASKARQSLRLLIRCAVLWLIGLFLNNAWAFDPSAVWRTPGVLQSLAQSLLLAGLVVLFVPRLRLQLPRDHWGACSLPFGAQWACVLALQVVYVLLTKLLAVPGCPRGYYGGGGELESETFHTSACGGVSPCPSYASCAGGASGMIDRAVYGGFALDGIGAQPVGLESQPFDPEGLLQSLTSQVLLVFFGVQAGRIFSLGGSVWWHRALRWCVWGVGSALLGVVLQFVVKVPLNARLNTPTTVCAVALPLFLLTAVAHVAADIQRWLKFVWCGMVGTNSLAIYCAAVLLGKFGTDMTSVEAPMVCYRSWSFVRCWWPLLRGALFAGYGIIFAIVLAKNRIMLTVPWKGAGDGACGKALPPAGTSVAAAAAVVAAMVAAVVGVVGMVLLLLK